MQQNPGGTPTTFAVSVDRGPQQKVTGTHSFDAFDQAISEDVGRVEIISDKERVRREDEKACEEELRWSDPYRRS